MTKYVDEKIRLIFASPGLGHSTYMTMYQNPNHAGLYVGGMHRLKSKDLPERTTLEQAQSDLDAYAAKKGWKRVRPENECPYFNGVEMDGKRPTIKCNDSKQKVLLTWFNENISFRDEHVKAICRGDFRNCRPYIMRQLEEACFDTKASFWDTEEASLELARIRGEETMNTYYTKCGREFKKSSTATVTGYGIDLRENGTISEVYQVLKKECYEALLECSKCPFKVKVTKGYPAVFDKWECRAGSQPPNQENSWVGSLEDKNTIRILSLHNEFLESVMLFCKGHPELFAAYNQDEADCRRVISVSCSANKKGIAAKKELIDKFFSAIEAVSDERFEDNELEDTDFEEKDEQKCRVCGCTWDNACEGGCYWVEDDLCSKCAEKEANTLPSRPLELIEAEINFYKAQTASGIIEIGKRLIEAKQQLQHGEWGKWLEEKVDFSQNTANQFMRVAREFSNSESIKNLGTRKLFLLLDVPAEGREEFVQQAHTVNGQEKTVDEMTTRELQESIRAKNELEEKLKQTESELEKAKEHADKQAKYADEHMMRARQAEFEIQNKEKSINQLRLDKEFEIKQLTQQLEQAKRNSDTEKVRELGEKISKYQSEIEDLENDKKVLNTEINNLRKQLKEKPVEVTATKVVEQIPDDVRVSIYGKVTGLYEGLLRLTEAEMRIFAEDVQEDYYEDVIGQIGNAISVLQNLQGSIEDLNTDMINPLLNQ